MLLPNWGYISYKAKEKQRALKTVSKQKVKNYFRLEKFGIDLK
jgi:hypothetical protein